MLLDVPPLCETESRCKLEASLMLFLTTLIVLHIIWRITRGVVPVPQVAHYKGNLPLSCAFLCN